MLKRLHPNTQGAALMMGSMAFFTLNDALVKLVGQNLSLWQIVSIRGALATCLIAVLARSLGALRFRMGRRDIALVLGRCASEMAATYLFLTALMIMPLATATAILQMLPLTVTLAAAAFLGERVGWRRYLAIVIGFAGMLLIVRPGPEGIGPGMLYALGSVVVLTFRDIFTRQMSPDVPSMTVTLAAAGSVTFFGLGLGWVNGWQGQGVSTGDLVLLAIAAGVIFCAYLCSVMTIRVGEISAVAPFRYTSLIWAALLGWLAFGEWPDGLTLLGAGIVALAGLFTLLREQKQKKRPRKTQSSAQS